MVNSVNRWTWGVQVKLWDPLPYLSTLEVWSRQGAIQIHVYLYPTWLSLRVTWLEDFLTSKWPGSFTALVPPLVVLYIQNIQFKCWRDNAAYVVSAWTFGCIDDYFAARLLAACDSCVKVLSLWSWTLVPKPASETSLVLSYKPVNWCQKKLVLHHHCHHLNWSHKHSLRDQGSGWAAADIFI